MDKTLDEKLDLLKEYARSPNVDEESFNEAINDWENELEKSRILKDYREADLSKQLTKVLSSFLLKIRRQLIDEEKPEERSALKADKKRCEWLLKFYNNSPESIIQSVENQVDEEIERLEL